MKHLDLLPIFAVNRHCLSTRALHSATTLDISRYSATSSTFGSCRLMSEMRTCDLSGAASWATRNRLKVLCRACMHWSIALTVRSQQACRSAEPSAGAVTAHCWRCSLLLHSDHRSEEAHWLRLHCTRFKRASISDHGEGTMAHTRGPTECVKRRQRTSRSRVLAARVSASDWEPSGGLPPTPAPPLAAHFLRWMTIMEDVQLARKPNNMNHCIRVQLRPSPARETPVRTSHHQYSQMASNLQYVQLPERLIALISHLWYSCRTTNCYRRHMVTCSPLPIISQHSSSALGHNGRSLQLAGSHGSRCGGAWLARDATNLIRANLIRRDALSCVFFQLCPLEVN